MKSYWGIANFISLGNAACGILSVFQSFSGHLEKASLFMLAAVLFDFLDGKTARRLGQVTLFGKNLDSLSDVISFGVAPAVLGFLTIRGDDPLVLGILVVFVLAGAWRLAFYNQWAGTNRPPGMPITINGIAFPVLVFTRAPGVVFPLTFALSTAAMVVPIFVSRPRVS